jgi:hypothetical protein
MLRPLLPERRITGNPEDAFLDVQFANRQLFPPTPHAARHSTCHPERSPARFFFPLLFRGAGRSSKDLVFFWRE